MKKTYRQWMLVGRIGATSSQIYQRWPVSKCRTTGNRQSIQTRLLVHVALLSVRRGTGTGAYFSCIHVCTSCTVYSRSTVKYRSSSTDTGTVARPRLYWSGRCLLFRFNNLFLLLSPSFFSKFGCPYFSKHLPFYCLHAPLRRDLHVVVRFLQGFLVPSQLAVFGLAFDRIVQRPTSNANGLILLLRSSRNV